MVLGEQRVGTSFHLGPLTLSTGNECADKVTGKRRNRDERNACLSASRRFRRGEKAGEFEPWQHPVGLQRGDERRVKEEYWRRWTMARFRSGTRLSLKQCFSNLLKRMAYLETSSCFVTAANSDFLAAKHEKAENLGHMPPSLKCPCLTGWQTLMWGIKNFWGVFHLAMWHGALWNPSSLSDRFEK